ncbi:MAG: PEP/pyruvate-binding domain-containing protein, partial [Candidatus Micrarchaeia archaeon]
MARKKKIENGSKIETATSVAAKDLKRVYLFEEGSSKMRPILGGKGCELGEMTSIGLPVPPGFIVTTQQCLEYQKTKK